MSAFVDPLIPAACAMASRDRTHWYILRQRRHRRRLRLETYDIIRTSLLCKAREVCNCVDVPGVARKDYEAAVRTAAISSVVIDPGCI